MFDIKGNFTAIEPRRGLYRVWIVAQETQNASLVSVWIDPAMSGFESDVRKLASECIETSFPSQPETSDSEYEPPASCELLSRINVSRVLLSPVELAN